MRKEQPLAIIMKLWKSALCLGNIPLQRLELRAKRRKKMRLHVGNFPLFSLNFFKCSDVIAVNLGLGFSWAGSLF
jgi:uncharacterized membrane protein